MGLVYSICNDDAQAQLLSTSADWLTFMAPLNCGTT